ncbi:MAG: hydroxymethylbilane synthase [Actinomycetota bacterium]
MSGTAPLRLATRRSLQATTQAQTVADAITAVTDRPTELVFVDTFGDRTQADDVPLHAIGGQGVFVKEVQRAVLDGRADVAVHSAKDVPSEIADGLVIAAFTARRSPNDVLVGRPLADLAPGATVATGSVRRRAQLAAARTDLHFAELRGNIPSRLEKVPDGGSIVMALAALEILELTDRIAEVLPVVDFVPAVGQGCVAVECRVDDLDTISEVSAVDHPDSRRAVEIERAFLGELGSGCSLPVGAHVVDSVLHAFLADSDRGVHETRVVELPPSDHPAGIAVARRTAVDLRSAVGG